MNECIINLGAMNWLSILVAGIAGYVLGGIWYSKALFGNLWMKLQGFKEEDLKGGQAKPMIVTFITTLLTAFVLEAVIATWGITFVGHAMPLTILFGLFLYSGNLLSDYLYSKKPMKLFWIVAMYRVVMILVMSIILILWQ
jgi:hypothetical protein